MTTMPLADRSRYGQPPLLALGLVAFLFAVLSIVDMYLPRFVSPTEENHDCTRHTT
jgi:hypothetical protein